LGTEQWFWFFSPLVAFEPDFRADGLSHIATYLNFFRTTLKVF
jgi:hypothetical protein